MGRITKRIIKFLVAIIAVIVMFLVLAIGMLTMPGPFFPEEKQYGAITVHSERPIGPESDSIMTEIFTRLEAVPVYNPEKKFDLCLCTTQEKFSWFARLTLRNSRIMGFALWGSCFVNGDFLKELAEKTGGRPKYMAREGSIVHVATHELMHEYLADAYGQLSSRSLPEWKVEGYCEYGVNQIVAPRDSGYSIGERIDIYLDDTQWNAASETHRPHYIWGLMMEYLVNIRGMSIKEVMADSITRDEVYAEMMAWQRDLRGRKI